MDTPRNTQIRNTAILSPNLSPGTPKIESLEEQAEKKRKQQERERKNQLRKNIGFGGFVFIVLIGTAAWALVSIKSSEEFCPTRNQTAPATSTVPPVNVAALEQLKALRAEIEQLKAQGIDLTSPTSEPKADLYACSMNDSKLWKMLVVFMSAGALGGLVFELLNLKGNIEWPHGPTKDELAAKFAYATPDNLYDLGYLARLFIGALSAPITVAVIQPNPAIQMIATSVVAGSAGALIFRALQDRLAAAIYQERAYKEQAETESQTKTANAQTVKNDLETACSELTALKQKVGAGLTNADLMDVTPEDFQKIFQPLKNAQALAKTIGNTPLQEQVSKASDACGLLQHTLDNFRRGKTPPQTLDPEVFNQVAKHISDAIGTATSIIPSSTNTTAQPPSINI